MIIVITVKLPRADWDTVIYMLEDMAAKGYHVGGLAADITGQADRQEG
jgi:hypothetical protein